MSETFPAPQTETWPHPPELEPGVYYCANHAKVQTGLRCNQCGKPICARCAKLTPIGYRCKECISGQQRVFDTSQWYDYPVAFFTAGILSLLGSIVASMIGFFILFLAPIIGVGIAEAIRFLTRRRRSKTLFQFAAIGTVLGSAPISVLILLGAVLDLYLGGGMFGFLPVGIFGLIWQGLYIFTVTSTVYYRLRGVTMR
jgi:hypothetical protein